MGRNKSQQNDSKFIFEFKFKIMVLKKTMTVFFSALRGSLQTKFGIL